MERAGLCRGPAEDDGLRSGEGFWIADGYVSFEGLGREPAAILGHADSDGLLPERACRDRAGWCCCAAGECTACCVASAGGDYAGGRVAAGEDSFVREYDVSGVRGTGAA